jgi:hypothetical protein
MPGYKAGGASLVTFFADSLAIAPAAPRNVISPPSDNWIYVPLGGDLPVSNPIAMATYTFGQLLSGGVTGLKFGQVQYGVNPPYSFATGIIPRVAYVGSPIYAAKIKFVQYTFNNIANAQFGIGIVNFTDATGTGSAGTAQINHDAYIVDQGGGGAGTPGLIRYNSGANNIVINAGTGAAQLNDVIRVSFDFTNPAQASIQVRRNGVLTYTQVDAAANRLTGNGCPVIAVISLANALAGGCNNFSCGVGL